MICEMLHIHVMRVSSSIKDVIDIFYWGIRNGVS